MLAPGPPIAGKIVVTHEHQEIGHRKYQRTHRITDEAARLLLQLVIFVVFIVVVVIFKINCQEGESRRRDNALG